MRQFICIFSAFALLIGCVKIDPTTTTGQESEAVIAFDCPIVGVKAKSVLEAKQYPDNLNFRVWGFYSENGSVSVSNGQVQTLYMNGAEFGCQGDVWGSVGPKQYYWPKSGCLHFLGFAPASPKVALTESAITDQGLQLTGYTVPNDADEDLLVSEVAYACRRPEVEGAGAPLLFHHALSSVVFKACSAVYGDRDGDPEERIDTDLRITKIEILQARSQGNFNQEMSHWNAEQMDEPSIEKGWSVAESSPRKDFIGYKSAAGTVLTDVFQYCHDTQLAPEDEGTYALTNLIMLPQEIKDDVILKVTYDMTNSKMSEANGTNEPVWVPDQVKTIPLNQCGVTEWLRGTRYCYYITLSLNKIQCSTDVVEWFTTEIDTDVEDLSVREYCRTLVR